MDADPTPHAPTVTEVGQLLARIGAASGHDPLSDDRRRALDRVASDPSGASGPPPFLALLARRGPAGRLVGYAELETRGRRAIPTCSRWRPSPDPGRTRWPAPSSTACWRPWATRAAEPSACGRPGPPRPTTARRSPGGSSASRDLLQMRCRLPLEHAAGAGRPPVAIRTRPFRVGEDEEAWLVVNNRAFATHPEQGHWDRSTLLERETEPWFDPNGFLVLEEDGRMAGSCWTKVHTPPIPPWVRST